MPEDLDEKLDRQTGDFVARLEAWLADRPPLSQIQPIVIDVTDAQPKGYSKLMTLIKLIAPVQPITNITSAASKQRRASQTALKQAAAEINPEG